MSKTQDAIALVNQGVAPFAAAKQVGLSANTLYVALKKEKEKAGIEQCPCCNQVVRAGFEIDHSVLKGGSSGGDCSPPIGGQISNRPLVSDTID
jgi:hypothetical protein